MPKHEQAILLNNIDTETALAIGYQAMKNLDWAIQFAGDNKILGSTPRNWKTFGQQILLDVQNDTLTVTSEMVNGESFDMLGKNKKATAAFAQAFALVKNSIDEAAIEANKNAINALRAATVTAVEQEQQQAEEVDKAMNLSGSNIYVTYGIIALNVLVFILMAINGAGIFEADGYVHIKWGSDYAPLTLSGDWWRLVTNVFIHFGIIHLLMNMYCLYTVGIYLEPMLGKARYTAAYLCTGVLASIVSLYWHTEPVNSAGASGAVFGMYGLFLALLTTSLIPKQVRQSLLQSIAIFIAYNLFFGLKGGVDNAAHIGGLLSGFVIGYIYVFAIKKEKQEQKLQWITPAVILLTLSIAFGYLQQNIATAQDRAAALNMVEAAGYKDNSRYQEQLNSFSNKDSIALNALKGADSITRTEFVKRLNDAIPVWDSARSILKSTTSYTLPEKSHKKILKLLEYVNLRIQEYNLLSAINSTDTEDEKASQQLKETSDKIAKLIEELNTL